MTPRSVAAAAPFIVAVPVLFGLGVLLAGHPFELIPFVAGAIGWTVALALRAPVALIGARLLKDNDATQRVVVLVSGPSEEGVRLLAVLLIGRDLGSALWLGLGWAAIEVVYSLVNGFAVAKLAQRDDPEAQMARAMLPPQLLEPAAPYWGVVERTSATALHMGFTLIVAAQPVAAIINAIAHSLVNYGSLTVLRRYGMTLMQAGLFVAGALILVIGLVVS